MPRISIQIVDASKSSPELEILTLDFPLEFTIHDLKNTIQNETQLPVELQHLYLDSKLLGDNSKSLGSAGIKDGEMLVMIWRPQSTQSLRQQRTLPPMITTDTESYRLAILHNPRILARVREQKPELAAALNDPASFREVFQQTTEENEESRLEEQRQNALLNETLSREAQEQIEEKIRLQHVSENAEEAYRLNPEAYGRVTMLYINTEVNGHPIKALVDSGAQATIMSAQCAEACGIIRLLDKRYSGIAKGVGTARILGHVHSAEITIGDAILRCSFTVMEGKDIDLLFGLDMLKRYQACIDLFKNKLVFPSHEVPFLPEWEIPKHLEEAAVNEPTVPGPNGTEIGGRSGAIRPAGLSSNTAPAASASSSSATGTGTGTSVGQSSGASASSLAARDTTARTVPKAAPRTAAETPSYPQSAIDQLCGLGFSKEKVVLALNASNGNIDYAAGFLFEN